METLQDLREQLDVIDAQIVELYQKRMDVCGKVGEYKITAGKKVFDKLNAEKLRRIIYFGMIISGIIMIV